MIVCYLFKKKAKYADGTLESITRHYKHALLLGKLQSQLKQHFYENKLIDRQLETPHTGYVCQATLCLLYSIKNRNLLPTYKGVIHEI